MESWMRVGARCVCVDDAVRPGDKRVGWNVKKDEIYTINEIAFGLDTLGAYRFGFIFDEQPAHLQMYGSDADRFWPLFRQTDIASLRALLDQPADPALVREALDDATLDVVQRIGMKF